MAVSYFTKGLHLSANYQHVSQALFLLEGFTIKTAENIWILLMSPITDWAVGRQSWLPFTLNYAREPGPISQSGHGVSRPLLTRNSR